ncbi:MAG: diguanylate cyclase [Gammaproteobacteria bacterium]
MSEISGNKQRLLIVDDSKVIRVTARKILQNHFDTVEAVDGNNAWDILTSQEPFSLIVSDLTMPNLDGFGLLEKIRNSHLPHVSDIPVIIITGANDSETTMQRATAAGATDFIGKPFDSVHLLARTQAHASSYTVNNALTDENISLEDQLLVDPLTGLANDTAFMEQGCQQLAYAIRHDTGMALASLEINNFSDLVKQHDTAAGELVIKAVASALTANIRKEDMAARTGTARFALLLPSMNTTGVSKLSERITGDIGKHAVMVGGKRVRFTVSIGIAVPDIQPDTSFDDLLASAGDSLKQARASGSNRVIPDEPHINDESQDSAEPGMEWSLEPIEQKASFLSPEQDEALPDIECVEIATLEPPPELDAEPLLDTGGIVLESEPDETELVEPLAAAHFDTALVTDTAADEHEETIVITSPYSLYDLEEVEIASPTAGPDTTAEADDQVEAYSTPVPETTESATQAMTESAMLDEIDDEGTMEDRPGVLRRLLRALFGRRY